MSVQNIPGTLTLANQLAAGITAESVAVAETSIATNKLESNMTGFAQDQYVQGQKMAPLVTAMQWIQFGLLAVTLVTGGVGAIASAGFIPTSTVTGQIVTSGVKAATELTQGAAGLAIGAMQARKSTLQASIQLDTTAATVQEKVATTNGDVMKTLSQGESKVGSAIVQMVQSTGSVMSNKFAR